MKGLLYTDGGARGNPGPAGTGFVLAIKGKEEITAGEYIGETTNNQAEYKALISGMRRAAKEGVTDLDCFLDSELVVKQLNGEYKVRDADLRPLSEQVRLIAAVIGNATFSHIPRERNKKADKLVNKAIDEHKKT